MTTTGLEVFDQTVQTTNIWLKEIMEELGPERRRAYEALRAVLHALRDRLGVDESAHLAAQLPMLVRGIYFEGWKPAAVPSKERTKEAFLARVEKELGADQPFDTESAVRAVFKTLGAHIAAGEAEDIRQSLPAPIRAMWPEIRAVV